MIYADIPMMESCGVCPFTAVKQSNYVCAYRFNESDPFIPSEGKRDDCPFREPMLAEPNRVYFTDTSGRLDWSTPKSWEGVDRLKLENLEEAIIPDELMEPVQKIKDYIAAMSGGKS